MTEIVEKKTRVNKSIGFERRIAELEANQEALLSVIGKMAHFVGGNIPKICTEFGVEVWQPDMKSMAKYK